MGFSVAATDIAPLWGSAVASPADLSNIRQHAAGLRASDDLKRALIEEEGVRRTVYRDGAGFPTVGVGHLVTASDGLSVGDRVGNDDVLDFLDRDLRHAEGVVARMVGDLTLSQHEFDALVDLVFNVGEGSASAEGSPNLHAAIAAGDHDAIARELTYRRAGGGTLRGLAIRSERRTQIFTDGDYDDPRENA